MILSLTTKRGTFQVSWQQPEPPAEPARYEINNNGSQAEVAYSRYSDDYHVFGFAGNAREGS